MKTSAMLESDDWLYIIAQFEDEDSVFGKWILNIRFIMNRVSEKNRVAQFGIYNPREGEWILQWSGEAVKFAPEFIRAILDKGGYKAVTIISTDIVGEEYLGTLPETDIQTVKLGTDSIKTLQESLDYITNELKVGDYCRTCEILKTIGKKCSKHQ